MSLLRPARFIHLSLSLGALATLAQAQSANQTWTLPLTQTAAAQQAAAQQIATQQTATQQTAAQQTGTTTPIAVSATAVSAATAAPSTTTTPQPSSATVPSTPVPPTPMPPTPMPPIPATPASPATAPATTDAPAISSPESSKPDASKPDTSKPDTSKPESSTATPPADSSKPATAAQAITVKFEATLPALIHGKKTTLPLTDKLIIPADVVAGVKKANQLTPQAAKLLSAFVAKATAPADARFEQQKDGSWAIVQHNALIVDMVVAKLSLQQATLQGDTSLTLLPTVGKAPNRTLDYFASRGITDFLAAGKTNYDGSSKARMTNIHVGTHFFQDRLFEGKAFSFNQFIGPITEKAGYVPGLVIAGERTASGIGGGICQVSTTVFRALYGAGLTIKERRNHSYQVYYYAPQGLDATIYQPTQDLRFTNDAGPLWFQSTWDDKTADLVVMVFGKPRGFEVQIKEPRVLKTTPAPADKIIVDNTLKPGQKKQIDWAAQGAVVEVDRLFVKGGKTVHKDTLKSSYRPWPNIFLVGSKPAAK